MCGIFGLATTEKNFDSTRRKETFLNGLMFNMPRGMDSTGAAGFWTEGAGKTEQIGTRVSKRALHMIDWLGTNNAELFLDKFSDYYYVIGHVRATTKGATSDKNAHPFQYGNYTLVHNGTVYNRGELVKAKEFVDSADICATMAERGEIKTLEGLEGGFALVWHNAEDNSLNFARNPRKPLAFAYVKKTNEMFYCSEWSVLWSVLVRNGIKVDGLIQITRPHVQYKFFKEDLRKFEEMPFEPYTRPPTSHRTAGQVGRTTHYLPAPKAQETQVVGPTEATDTAPNLPTTNSTASDGDTGPAATTPSKRHKYINDMLSVFNLSVGALIVMKTTEWRAYPHSRGLVGHMIGHRLAKPEQILNVPEIPHSQWTLWENKEIGVVIENYKEMEGKHTIWCKVQEGWTNNLLKGPKKSVEGSKSDKEIDWDDDLRRYTRRRVTPSGAIVNSLLSAKEAADILGQSMDEVERRMRLPKVESRVYWGPGGRKVTAEEWARYTSDGCGECTSAIDGVGGPADGRALVWVENSPLCAACSMREDAAQRMGLKDKVH